MNTIKDLLRDLVQEVEDQTIKLKNAEIARLQQRKNPDLKAMSKTKDYLVEEYYNRFIKEISKYFELEI